MDEQDLGALSHLPMSPLPAALSRRTLARARAQLSTTPAARIGIDHQVETLPAALVPLALASADLVLLIDSMGKMLRAFGR
jgi:hypothetical protein